MPTNLNTRRYRGWTILLSASGNFEFIMDPQGYDKGAVEAGGAEAFIDDLIEGRQAR